MKHARALQSPSIALSCALFACVSLIWLAIDRITKAWADSATPGAVLMDDVIGLFEFRLVHNTGAAWGIFSDSTFALGIFSIVVCVAILVLFFAFVLKDGTYMQSFALGLVFAGGIGNAIDRLAYSYVVDFINAKFISFPVFNVADIGVTCGLALFVISLFLQGRVDSDAKGA